MNERQKENAVSDFVKMIEKSWTYARLTESEKACLHEVIYNGKFKGNYIARWEQLYTAYHFFLAALGYKPSGWREPETETPLF